MWANTILNHIDIRVILPRREDHAWYIDPYRIEHKNIIKYMYDIDIQKM
jgi:hypothetical protein